MLQHKALTFNDGVVKVYGVTDTSTPGNKPTEGLTLKQTLRYKERTVGFNRFFTALQHAIKVQYVLRCPKVLGITTQDVAIPNDGKQYRILQVQYPEDVDPPVMDLTLEEVLTTYAIS